jgi:dsDNA-specific endonuclease/ATPase MutS2
MTKEHEDQVAAGSEQRAKSKAQSVGNRKITLRPVRTARWSLPDSQNAFKQARWIAREPPPC